MQVLASQLHFLANRNAGLAIPPLFWPVNCIKIGGHVALLSGPTVYLLYCGVDYLLRNISEYEETICVMYGRVHSIMKRPHHYHNVLSN